MDQAQQSERGAPPALNDAIEKIMAHPELISMVASVLGTEKGTKGGEVSTRESADAGAEETADTHAVSAVAQGEPMGKELPKEFPELVSTLAPLLSGLGRGGDGKKGSADSRSACLLRALKPYVSHGRREAIDYMIRITELSEVLRHLH